MIIDQLEAQAAAGLPEPALKGARSVASAQLPPGLAVEVICRINRNGQRVFDHRCNGKQMSRRTLLLLLCPVRACPQSSAVLQRWQDFHGGTPLPAARGGRAPRAGAPAAARLIDEVVIDAAGHHCVARPARFACLTACPMGAHPPQVLDLPGWDLFEDGAWLAGGSVTDPATGQVRPRLPTLADARQCLAQHHAAAARLLRRLR